MPPNRKANSKNPKDWSQFDFVELRLSDTDKTKFKGMYEKDSQVFFTEVDGLTKNGYKLSVSYDTSNNCEIASLTCKEPNDPNFNNVLTARAGDFWEAVALVMFKHLFMCDDGDWGGETQADARQWG